MTCRESVHACVHVESLFWIKLVGRVGTECCGADRVKRMFILMSRCTVAQPLPPPSPFNDLKIIVPCVLQPVWFHGHHTSHIICGSYSHCFVVVSCQAHLDSYLSFPACQAKLDGICPIFLSPSLSRNCEQ